MTLPESYLNLLTLYPHASSSQITPRLPQRKKPSEFRHSLNSTTTNSILNNSPILHFINENTSLHNANVVLPRNNHGLPACSSVINLRSNKDDERFLPVTSRINQDEEANLSRRAIHNSVNQLRLSNKNYVWPRNYSQQLMYSNRSRSSSKTNRLDERSAHSVSHSACSVSLEQRQQRRPNSSTNFEMRERLGRSLDIAACGDQASMSRRKHEFGLQNNKFPNELTRSTQNIQEVKVSRSKRPLSVDFDIREETKSEEDERSIKVMSNYNQGIPFKHVNDVEDRALILDFFDPIKSDNGRAEMERYSKLLEQDSIGFQAIQQKLKSFDLIKALKIGGRKTRIELNSIQNMDKIYSQLVLNTYRLLQKPRQTPLQEFYTDYEEGELNGEFKTYMHF